MSLPLLSLCLLLPPMIGALLLLRSQASRTQAITVARVAPLLILITAVIGLVLEPATGVPFGYDRLSGLLALLIGILSLVVQRYSIRAMQADARFVVFFAHINLLTAALLVFVTATHLLTLAAGWVMMSLALVPLLRHRRGWAPAEAAARRADRVFLVGDLALLLGVGLLIEASGTGVIHNLAAAGAAPSWLHMLGLGLIVLAALSKTAIIPFHSWLPQTMTAPTPVSALMHAGFVNAGGIVLAKLAGVLSAAPEILLAVFVIGAVTALYGSAVMQVQTDVKRQLGASTVGQMGFMIMQCGIGAFSAAIVHLVAHSLYKATLFLGSGSVIQHADDLKAAFPSTPTRGATLAALTAAIMMLCIGILVLIPLMNGEGGGVILAVFAALAMAETSRSLLRQQASAGVVAFLTLIAGSVVMVVYGGVLGAAKGWLGDAAPTLNLALTPLHLGVAGVFVLAAFVPHLHAAGLLPIPQTLKDRLYLRLFRATHMPDTFAGRTVS
jgi:NAD(P)H-quinone oxidoreductase subunit 5